MMTKEQGEVVRMVYNRFIASEEETWTELDDNIEFISYLNNSELVKEVTIKYFEHSRGIFRCNQNHEQRYCFAPYVLEAVDAIITLYEKTSELHPKNAYILSYYMAMSELRILYVD
jgi:hypothetical protein